MPFAGILTSDDDRKGYAEMLAVVGGDVPLVRVGQVFEHDLGDVELLTFTTLAGQSGHGQQCYHHQEDYRFKLFHVSKKSF